MKGLHRREILSLLGVYHSKDIKPINKWLEKIGSKKVYADVKKRLSTAVLVDKVYQFCLFFSGRELYPYQEQFARRIIRSVIENDGEEITALFSRQSGKCLARGTKVLMYDGSLKNVEDIKIGDKVMTPDSSYATVTNLGNGYEEMYEVQPYQGKYESTYTVNKSHILALYDTKTGQYINMEVSKYLKLSESRKKQLCGYRARIEFKYQETEEDPYEYGYRIASTEGLYDPMDLRLDKQYLINDEIARQDLLAGILDACGHFNLNDKRRRNSVAIRNVNPIIAEDYLFLLKSLGFRAFLRPVKVKNVHTKEGYKINYRIHASGDFSCIPTKTKQNPSGNCRRGDLIYHIKLKPKGEGAYFGFTIDSKDRLFVLGDFTVTHNTETVACVTCGLQVILPTLANMPMFANDPRLQPFREGIKIGIFAPALQQAQTNYMRMKSFLTSKRAVSILESEEFNLQFSTSNGQTTSLSNGSRCTCFSASERSNIEGESFNFIICEECFVKGTPVLTSTGYKPIEEIKIGEYVYSYNHEKHKIELKKVLRSFSQPLYNRKVVTITTESGKTIVCTDNHKIFNVESNTYTRADSLHLGGLVFCYYKVGELSWVFEEKIKSIKIEEHEEIEVFDLTIEDNHNFFANSILVHNCQDISNFVLTKSISPMGAAYNATKVCIGTATVFKGYFYDAIQRNKELAKNRSSHIKNHFEFDYTIASKYNPNYAKYIEKEKRNLGENSDSFRMSYKLEWIMERGMFIDIDKFEKNNLEPLMDFIDFDREATHVVGIDIGGGSGGDSTVVTVVEVDWDMPVISETRYDEDEGHEYTFDAFNTYVKYFLEIKETPDHEEQYYIITEFLRNFKVARIVVDATREKSFADRLNANVSAEVIPYVFTVGAKSDLYKTFDKELSSGRAKLPASEKAKSTVEYEKCVQQLADLQKNWRGTNLLVSHPETRGAHDDYPDSWALAVWGCMQKGEVSEIECRDSRSLFGSPNRRNETPQMKFNRATAKRRRH